MTTCWRWHRLTRCLGYEGRDSSFDGLGQRRERFTITACWPAPTLDRAPPRNKIAGVGLRPAHLRGARSLATIKTIASSSGPIPHKPAIVPPIHTPICGFCQNSTLALLRRLAPDGRGLEVKLTGRKSLPSVSALHWRGKVMNSVPPTPRGAIRPTEEGSWIAIALVALLGAATITCAALAALYLHVALAKDLLLG
jgi:hypothetical protein